MHISLILAKIDVLKFHPEWVDGGPGLPGPVLRTALTEYAIAGLVHAISTKTSNTEAAATLQQTAKELVAESARRLTSDFAANADDPDDICPPYRPHFPHPRGEEGIAVSRPHPDPWLVSGPQPDPWLEASVPAVREIALAVALRDLATVTTIAKASAALKQAGEGMMKGAASRVFEEYCGTVVKPRTPQPHPQGREKAVA